MQGHDEGMFSVRIGFAVGIGQRGCWSVRDISDPFAVFPLDHPSFRTGGLSLQIDGCTVIENPAVDRPGPGKFRVEPDLVGGVIRLATGGHVSGIRITAGIYPATACRAAVGLKQGEGRHLFSGLVFRITDLDVSGEGAVDDLGDLVGIELMAGPVVPFEVHNWIRKDATVLLVNFLQFETELQNDVAVRTAVAERFGSCITPLHPASAVGNAAFLFHRNAGR